jgi:hypothetical protein
MRVLLPGSAEQEILGAAGCPMPFKPSADGGRQIPGGTPAAELWAASVVVLVEERRSR